MAHPASRDADLRLELYFDRRFTFPLLKIGKRLRETLRRTNIVVDISPGYTYNFLKDPRQLVSPDIFVACSVAVKGKIISGTMWFRSRVVEDLRGKIRRADFLPLSSVAT